MREFLKKLAEIIVGEWEKVQLYQRVSFHKMAHLQTMSSFNSTVREIQKFKSSPEHNPLYTQ